eukprot:Rhum_TRINITY_DN24835_c0_g1::Rhum_TRINITY_DN24835_c0_g1_i1::g.180237::m.180237
MFEHTCTRRGRTDIYSVTRLHSTVHLHDQVAHPERSALRQKVEQVNETLLALLTAQLHDAVREHEEAARRRRDHLLALNLAGSSVHQRGQVVHLVRNVLRALEKVVAHGQARRVAEEGVEVATLAAVVEVLVEVRHELRRKLVALLHLRVLHGTGERGAAVLVDLVEDGAPEVLTLSVGGDKEEVGGAVPQTERRGLLRHHVAGVQRKKAVAGEDLHRQSRQVTGLTLVQLLQPGKQRLALVTVSSALLERDARVLPERNAAVGTSVHGGVDVLDKTLAGGQGLLLGLARDLARRRRLRLVHLLQGARESHCVV